MNLDGWTAYRGWTPDPETRAELDELTDTARTAISTHYATSSTPKRWPADLGATIHRINLRLEAAGLPTDLADAVVTWWIMMRDHWDLQECIVRGIEPGGRLPGCVPATDGGFTRSPSR